MTASPKALIAGAGIGGLATAIALRRLGWQVRVFERSPDARAPGFALVLAPNALAALRELGLAESVIAESVPVGTVEVRRTDSHVLRKFRALPEPQARWRSLVALRSALYGVLLAAVGRESVVFGHDAVGFDDVPDGVTLRFTDGRTDTGDILIGADGVGSAIRKQLHRSEPPPRSSGFCALRGVAYDAQRHLAGVSVVGYLGPGIEAATARAGENAVYWYLSMLTGDIPTDSCGAMDVLAHRTQGFDASFRAIAGVTLAEDMRFDELWYRRPLRNWGRGRVTLLGDAAHPMLPHTGQGAAQALEDAVALGLSLAGGKDRAVRDAGVRLMPEALFALSARLGERDPHRRLRTNESHA